MTHSDVVAASERWLRKRKGVPLIAVEFVTGAREIPDVIGWKAGFSYYIEAKVSVSDFKREYKKAGYQFPGLKMGNQRWYAIPHSLKGNIIHLLPEKWGLLLVKENGETIEYLESEHFSECCKSDEVVMLQSALRRLGVTKIHTKMDRE